MSIIGVTSKFAVFGVQTTLLMEVLIFWNAFATPIGCWLFGVIRIFPKCL